MRFGAPDALEGLENLLQVNVGHSDSFVSHGHLILLPDCRPTMSTRPPSGEYLMALLTRLLST